MDFHHSSTTWDYITEKGYNSEVPKELLFLFWQFTIVEKLSSCTEIIFNVNFVWNRKWLFLEDISGAGAKYYKL